MQYCFDPFHVKGVTMSTSLLHFSSVFCIIGVNFIITDIFTERTAWQLEKKGNQDGGG